jgi:hypothetical protein
VTGEGGERAGGKHRPRGYSAWLFSSTDDTDKTDEEGGKRIIGLAPPRVTERCQDAGIGVLDADDVFEAVLVNDLPQVLGVAEMAGSVPGRVQK